MTRTHTLTLRVSPVNGESYDLPDGVVDVADAEFDVGFDAICHNDLSGNDRDCVLYDESASDCPMITEEEPEFGYPCGGKDFPAGHFHPVAERCALQHWIDNDPDVLTIGFTYEVGYDVKGDQHGHLTTFHGAPMFVVDQPEDTEENTSE